MDKRIEAEFHLPEAIIQHIQSFLNAKEAAQTTLLSKSWYGAWLTRPNLDFDYQDFQRNYDMKDTLEKFCEFVEKTVERYEKLNLKIHTLKLHSRVHYSVFGKNCMNSVASKCIVKALKMGATGLDFNIDDPYSKFALPHEVFGSENLIRLSLSGCKIGLGADGKVSCWRLKSLTLESVYVEDDIIRDIILSCCPLIENLSLSPYGPGVQSVDSPFNKLKSLFLHRIVVDTLFFDDFSSRFPCLKDLSLDGCLGYKEIQISSPLLECISFTKSKMIRVKFDVPSIRKFTFSGVVIPSLLFKTTSSKWESNISISRFRSPKATWLRNLNKLLKKLSLSKVSLFVEWPFRKRFDCPVPEDVKGLPKSEVENLSISLANANYLDVLEGLFWCCRPIYVTLHWNQLRISEISDWGFLEDVYKSLIKEVGLNCGLDQVDVEFFDEAASTWQPRLVDASTIPGADEQSVRLHLIWRC